MDAKLINAFRQITHKLHLEFKLYNKKFDQLKAEYFDNNHNNNDTNHNSHNRNNSHDNINEITNKDAKASSPMHLKPSFTQENLFTLSLPLITTTTTDTTNIINNNNQHPLHNRTEQNYNEYQYNTIANDKGKNKLQESIFDKSFKVYKSTLIERNTRYINSIKEQKQVIKLPSPLKEYYPPPIPKQSKFITNNIYASNNHLPKRVIKLAKKQSIPVNPCN